MWVETIKQQTRAAYGRLVAGKSPWARTRSMAYGLYGRSVCDTDVPLQLQCAACGGI